MKYYLGDSVYAEDDGYDILLYLDNGLGPTNPIVLDPETIANLLEIIHKR